MSQLLYFARCVGIEGPIKIGCSVRPEERVKTLSVWAPFPVEVILVIPGNYGLERRLHAHFADLHSHREWFRADPRLLDVIARLKAGDALETLIDMSAPGTIRRNGRRKRTEDERRRQSLMLKMRWAEKRANKAGGRDDLRTPEAISRIVYRSGKENPTEVQQSLLNDFFADPIRHCVPLSTLYPERPPPAIPVSSVEAVPHMERAA